MISAGKTEQSRTGSTTISVEQAIKGVAGAPTTISDDAMNKIKIKINTSIELTAATTNRDTVDANSSNPLSTFTTTKDANNNITLATFTININVLKKKYNLTTYESSTNPYYNIITNNIELNKKNIKLTKIELITGDISSTPILYEGATSIDITKTKIMLSSDTKHINTYDINTRKDKMLRILYEILNKTPEEMMGYLLKQKLYYNQLIYNISLQMKIRNNYINNSALTLTNLNTQNYFSSSGAGGGDNSIFTNIQTAFNNMKDNVESLNNNIFTNYDNNFLINKYTYTKKIESLNEIKDKYEKIQNSLNVLIKEYNKYITNFTAIKQYANYVIIFLIIVIIITILISILSNITIRFKNSYYITTFIILLIITYLFYNRFHHVNLYEKFTVPTCTTVISYKEHNNTHKINHSTLCNRLAQSMNDYNISIKKLDNNININIYTIGNATYSTDANNYLYKLYMNKVQQNEVNRLKKVSLTNLIEGMKKQILYLFNIILLISCFTIIILFGLMLHSSFPFLLSYIIIICIILIIIMIIYFIFAIAQPTRLIANKNYWANNGPSENILNKL